MKAFIGFTTEKFNMHLDSIKKEYIKYGVYLMKPLDALELADKLFILYYDDGDKKVHYARVSEKNLREIYLFAKPLINCKIIRYTDALSRQYSLADVLNQQYCQNILIRLRLLNSTYTHCNLASRIKVKQGMSVQEAVDILNSMCTMQCGEVGGITVEIPVLLYVILKNMSTERKKTCPIHIAESEFDIDFPHY